MSEQQPMIFKGGFNERWYMTTHYKERDNGHFGAITKTDITDAIQPFLTQAAKDGEARGRREGEMAQLEQLKKLFHDYGRKYADAGFKDGYGLLIGFAPVPPLQPTQGESATCKECGETGWHNRSITHVGERKVELTPDGGLDTDNWPAVNLRLEGYAAAAQVLDRAIKPHVTQAAKDGEARGQVKAYEDVVVWCGLGTASKETIRKTAIARLSALQPTQGESKVECPTCLGKKRVILNRSREGLPNIPDAPCSTCHGTGVVAKEEEEE